MEWPVRCRAGLVWMAVALVALGLAVVLFAQLAQILTRLVGPLGLAGTDEVSRFAFVWAAFMGMAAGLDLGAHHAFGLLRERLSGAAAWTVAVVVETLTMLALLLLGWHGWGMALRAHQQLSPSLGLSMSWMYAAMPAAAILMALLLVLRWLERERA